VRKEREREVRIPATMRNQPVHSSSAIYSNLHEASLISGISTCGQRDGRTKGWEIEMDGRASVKRERKRDQSH
jgi:hypothetical protein